MAKRTRWQASDVPSQEGRVAVVTGANSGIGLEAVKGLAAAGAHVVLACRDVEKAGAARREVQALHPQASLEVEPLDLASLASVREFAKRVADRHPRLDLLVNNAGVMAIPRRTTVDGFEMQLGTNHLGHFALTLELLGALRAAPAARVVTVSSTAHRMGRIAWHDLHGERRYSRWGAYGQSKLANLLFAYELDRRLREAGARVGSLACHPGWAATNLQRGAVRHDGSHLLELAADGLNRLFAQSAAMGALPTLYAATAPDARSGDTVGPDRFAETWGHPTKVGASTRARDAAAARRLWDVSSELTGASL